LTDNQQKPMGSKQFEGEILIPILLAAQAQARSKAQNLSAVGRAILRKASKAAEPSTDGVAHPAARPSNAGRKRMRFRMPGDEYEVIKERIRASGESVTAALEKGLEQYARTGKF
jgi:hypothetical protein